MTNTNINPLEVMKAALADLTKDIECVAAYRTRADRDIVMALWVMREAIHVLEESKDRW